MTHMQVKMPEHLTAKDLEGISHVFGKMSLAAQQGFLAGLLVQYPQHYHKICRALGENYSDAMVYA